MNRKGLLDAAEVLGALAAGAQPNGKRLAAGKRLAG